MVARRHSKRSKRALGNQRRERATFAEMMTSANRRAHEQANRRGGRRELKSVRAVIDAGGEFDEVDSLEWLGRMGRCCLGWLMLPFCWVTMWTLLDQFSDANVARAFWRSAKFWYFAIGAMVMLGWFASGLLRTFYLYLYVLGHELTHAVFVWMFRGKVSGIHVSTQGGYITTNKTNLWIALSPYFVPFWAVVAAVVYAGMQMAFGLSPMWDLGFYAITGFCWAFHMAWTLWMLPRDQPDLHENGILLSLVVIFQANLLVLVGLLCVASSDPWHDLHEFGRDWLRWAATWGGWAWRWLAHGLAGLREAGWL